MISTTLISLSPFVLTLLFSNVNSIQNIATPTHEKVVVCYIKSWVLYKRRGGKFAIDYLKPEYCTHLIYAFAYLNATSWNLKEGEIRNYKRITALRDNYPGLKVSIAIGGWNEGSKNYSLLAAEESRRRVFRDSVIRFLRKHKFDGLDLNWQFPTQRGGAPEDKQNFALLVKELQNDLSQHNYTLTATIGSSNWLIARAYDIPNISKYLNYIHVMTSDYHRTSDWRILPNAPLYSTDNHSVDATMKYLLELGAPPEKLIMGLPMYARMYVLAKSVPADVSPIGKRAQKSRDTIMSINEVCQELTNQSWIRGWDNKSSTPYAVKKNQVICYDNEESLYEKVLYANKKNLVGVMVWIVDAYDVSGSCEDDYILIKSINKALKFNEIVSTTKRPNTATSLSHNPLLYEWYFTSFLVVFFSKIFI